MKMVREILSCNDIYLCCFNKMNLAEMIYMN